MSTVAQASTPAPVSSLSRLTQSPKKARTMKPASGSMRMRKGTICRSRSSDTCLPLHHVEGVDVQGVAVAVESDHDRETHRRLRRRHHDDKEDQHLAVECPRRPGEGDEGEVHAVQHELHAHQHRDHVPAEEDAERPEGEEHEAQDERVMDEGGVLHPSQGSFLASATAPTSAARMRIDVASNT